MVLQLTGEYLHSKSNKSGMRNVKNPSPRRFSSNVKILLFMCVAIDQALLLHFNADLSAPGLHRKMAIIGYNPNIRQESLQ